MRNLREALAADGVTVNGWVSADSPYLAETLSWSGYDCVTVDVQHGMYDLGGAVGLLQAVDLGPAAALARTPRLDSFLIGKLLDAGAEGIICPTLETVAEVVDFVAMCHYPPRGVRSFGPARGALAGRAALEPMAWAMIETAPAMEDLESIVAVEGLDAVFVGPNDLALALGAEAGTTVPPPVVMDALQQIVTAAHAAGIYAGAFCANGTVARQLAELGYDLVTPGSDMGLLKAAAGEQIGLARGTVAAADGRGGY